MTLADEFGKARAAAGLEIRFPQAEKIRSLSAPDYREYAVLPGRSRQHN